MAQLVQILIGIDLHMMPTEGSTVAVSVKRRLELAAQTYSPILIFFLYQCLLLEEKKIYKFSSLNISTEF